MHKLSSHPLPSVKALEKATPPFADLHLGLDNDSPEYCATLDGYVSRLLPSIPAYQREKVMGDLAERVQGQAAVCAMIENRYRASIPAFRARLPEGVGFIEFFSALTKSEAPRESNMVDLYHSFVSAPFENQVQMLRATAQAHGLPERAFPKVFALLLNVFLPPPEAEKKVTDGKLSAREVGFAMISPFCRVASQHQKFEFVTALLAALRHGHSLSPDMPIQERFGHRLGYFLNIFSQKVAQYAHSMPQTRDEWRPGLATSKSDDGHLPRWQVWRQIGELPSAVRGMIVRLGQRRGTGNYQTTYNVDLVPSEHARLVRRHERRLPDTTPIVLKLLKPNVAERSLTALNLIIRLCDDLAGKDAETRRTVEAIKRPLRHALHMVKYETDLTYAKQQEMAAFDVFSRLKITVDGERIAFRPTAIFMYGNDFQLAQGIAGEHLNHLCRLNDPRRRIYAIGLLLGCIAIKLSGSKSDHDTHGDNVAFCRDPNGAVAEHFDLGGFDTEDPTSVGKRLMVDVLLNSYFNGKKNRYPFLASLKHTMRVMEETGLPSGTLEPDSFGFIDSLQRGIISWGDCIKELLNAEPQKVAADVRAMQAALIKSGVIDNEIIAQSSRRLAAHWLLRFDRYADVMRKVPFLKGIASILEEEQFHRRHFYPDNPNSQAQRPLQPRSARDRPRVKPLTLSIEWKHQRRSPSQLILQSVGKIVY